MDNYSKNKAVTPWNKRNAQRAEIKQPGTQSYHKNFRNMVKQFFENGVKSACKCGSVYVRSFSQDDNLINKCANCQNHLMTLDTTKTKLAADDNEQVKIWKRSGRCPFCGYHSFGGKLYVNRSYTRYLLQLTCNCCNGSWEWIGEYRKT